MSNNKLPDWQKNKIPTACDPSKNALRHGCCAVNTLLLPTESVEDFKALETLWCKTYSPSNDQERHLVQALVNADWLLERTTHAHAAAEKELYALSPNPLHWTELQQKTIGRLLRYKTAQANLFTKAKKAMEDHRKARLNEKAAAVKEHIAKERLEIYKRKNRPEPTWKEHLQNMTDQAKALGIKPPGLNPIKL